MKKKIVVAVDSFKGSLSSSEIAQVIESTLDPNEYEVVKVPIADGGEGMTEALMEATEGQRIELEVAGPLRTPVQAFYGISPDGGTAFMEMAVAAGLPLVPLNQRNPMMTTTYGVGEMIMDALRRGCRQFLIGIGGSATNDGGLGMLRALGFRFFNTEGKELAGCGASLIEVATIDGSKVDPLVRQATYRIACDVNNPFSGELGAAHVYAPQKGADPSMVDQLDRGLRHFASRIERYNNRQIDSLPGAGAAGGLGGGFVAFLDAQLQPGIDLILEYLRFESRIEGAHLIITGEGRMDRQTLMGKAPSGVMQVGRRLGIPVIALSGRIDDQQPLLDAGFTRLVEVSPRDLPLEEVMRPEVASENIRRKVMLLFEEASSLFNNHP